MIKIKKATLVFLIILAVVCGAAGLYTLQTTGAAAKFGLGGGHVLNEEQYQKYRHLSKTYSKLDELRDDILNRYYVEVDEEALETGMLKGLYNGLGDPYSYYMTPSEYEQTMISLTGVYSGVGVTISAGDSGFVEVVTPTKGSPAEAAGLRKGDLILAVDGTEYVGADLDTCAAAIRGPENTDVTLTVRRDDEVFDVTITRKTIIAQTVDYKMLDDGIGYIAISGFEENTALDFTRALEAIQDQGARALIVDLRDKIVALGITDEIPAGGSMTAPVNNAVRDEAVAALTMLGFSPAPTQKVVVQILQEQPTLSVEQVVKLALKQIK